MSVTRREALAGGAAAVVSVPALAARPAAQPSKFLWGVATAAHQIEGGNVNSDYWVMEHVPGTYFKEKSGDACDSWNRWPEDLALIEAAGLNAYRFSVEWARIEPEPGEFSQATLDYYRRLCIACRERQIEPIVTLHHFTSPRWVAALGGWETPAVIDHYVRYAERTARALGDVTSWFCTMNEPNAQVTSKVLQRQP
jgi:beta-glucosidase